MNERPVVLVTGAARRLGAAIARHLHARGCDIALHYRSQRDRAAVLVEELNAQRPGSAAAFGADLLDIAAAQSMVDAVGRHFGRLDGLVNNASSFFPTPFADVGEAAWQDLVGSNLKAPLFLSQRAAPLLAASRGAIVNIVDIHADRPMPGYPVYSLAKTGLQGLTRVLAVELAPAVRVNGVAPGAIEWPEDGQFDAGEQERIIRQTLLGRVGAATDIAGAVAFLLLDAPYVTGQILAVDGGRSIHL